MIEDGYETGYVPFQSVGTTVLFCILVIILECKYILGRTLLLVGMLREDLIEEI